MDMYIHNNHIHNFFVLLYTLYSICMRILLCNTLSCVHHTPSTPTPTRSSFRRRPWPWPPCTTVLWWRTTGTTTTTTTTTTTHPAASSPFVFWRRDLPFRIKCRLILFPLTFQPVTLLLLLIVLRCFLGIPLASPHKTLHLEPFSLPFWLVEHDTTSTNARHGHVQQLLACSLLCFLSCLNSSHFTTTTSLEKKHRTNVSLLSLSC